MDRKRRNFENQNLPVIKLTEILNEPVTGKPLTKVVFRGDSLPFTKFDKANIGTGLGGENSNGFWFSSSKDAAEYFGPFVRAFEITMKNPLVFSEEEFVKGWPSGPTHFAKIAKQRGHDGVILLNIEDGDRVGDVYCVFSEEQIRPL